MEHQGVQHAYRRASGILISHLASKGYKARISAGAATDSRHPVEIVGFADEDEAMDAQESLSREEGLSSVLLKP